MTTARRIDRPVAGEGRPTTSVKVSQPSQLRLVDNVVKSLETAILSGEIAPGERLVESGLSEAMAVSRTTVREALLLLARSGLVRNEPRRGTFVTRLSRAESLDLCILRSLLESYAVASGLHRLTRTTLDTMHRLLDELSVLTVPQDVPRIIEIDVAFHERIIRCGDSHELMRLWTGLNGKLSALFLGSLEHYDADIADIVDLHEALLDALETGDPNVAQAAVVAHYVRDTDLREPRDLVATSMNAVRGRLTEFDD